MKQTHNNKHIIWSKDMEVGSSALDYEHKNICELINDLSDEVEFKEPTQWCSRIAIDLVESIDGHMKFEENLLQISKYEDLENHRKQHRSFMYDIIDLGNRIKSLDDKKAMLELRDYLVKHWVEHIMADDKQFSKII